MSTKTPARFKRKVVSTSPASDYVWDNQVVAHLDCGHPIRVSKRNGQPPKTVTCWKCAKAAQPTQPAEGE